MFPVRTFNKTSTDGSGKANVEAQTDEDVWGVLYTLGEADLRVLDRREAGYYREKTLVQTAEGSSIEAWVYLAQQPSRDPGLCPYTWYKRFLVEGAKAHSLPAQYTRALESIEATQDEDEQRDREKRAIACVS